MLNKLNAIREILRRKNSQLRLERERTEIQENINSVLSAYIAVLIGRVGSVYVTKKELSESIGRYRAELQERDGGYVISLVQREKSELSCEKEKV